MLLKAAITGNLRQAMEQEVGRVARALKRAVATTGATVQAQLRAQARGAGFKDGGRSMANAWRLKIYPRLGVGPNTLHPAAHITSNMPELAHLFDKGAVITAKRRKYLAIPTPINRRPGRRKKGIAPVRVTPQEMLRARGFVRPTRNPAVLLWCLPLRTETTKRGRVRVFAGRYAEVLTGRVKGAQAKRQAYAAARSFVPMFFLMRRVTLRKRLDIDSVRAGAAARFAANAVRELAA